jgi:hypothetical protein
MHPLGHYSVCISGHSHGPLHYTQFASHSHESLLHEQVMLGTALPALGFYPKILGFFEAVGIFLGFYFEK